MKLKIHLIAACALASLLGLHPRQTFSAESPSPTPDASAEHLRQVLVSYTWSWVDPRPKLWTEIHFNQDGTLTGWIGSTQVDTRRWEATGSHTAQMTGPGQDRQMRVFTFDDALTKFVCQVPDVKGSGKIFQITGNRLAPIAKSAPTAATAQSSLFGTSSPKIAGVPGAPSPTPPSAQIPQPAPAVHHISMSVEAVKSGSANQVKRSSAVHMTQAALHETMSANTAVGLEQVSNQSESLTITLHNLGQQVDAAHVEWFFVAGPIKPDLAKPVSAQEYIFDKGAMDVSLQGNGIQVVPAQSAGVTSVIKRSVSATMGGGRGLRQTSARAPELTGDVFRGWFVRLIADKKVLAVSGSKQAYEEMARDLSKLPIP